LALPEQRIFDGNHLRASLFNPDAPRLFVTFRQRLSDPGSFSEARPVQAFVKRDHSHLYIQSLNNDWYINPETSALADVLRRVSMRYKRVLAIGFSMGGYAALRFSKPLRLKQLIAVSPQYSIAPGVVPWDRRYHDCADGFDRVAGDLATAARKHLTGMILCDPFKPLDMMHAEMIQMVFPKLSICRLSGGGHPASRVLREGGHFGDFQRLLLSKDADPAKVIDMHRSSRHESGLYWQQMATVFERRKSSRLAEFAKDQAKALRIQGEAVLKPADPS
jgi:pimeloyl-ACP methyl ester carboxylesterase